MRKALLSILLVLPICLLAAERSVSEALALATQYVNQQSALSPARLNNSASSLLLTHTRAKLHDDAPAFYVFNQTNNQGFIIVSADDRTEDILAYSNEGAIDMNTINPNFRFWLNYLQEQISAANDSNAVDKSPSRKVCHVAAISPLLKNKNGTEIAWDQEEPFYNLCPMDERDSTRCLTGCVATATAQILCRWQYPNKGTSQHSYTWYNCLDDNCNRYKTKQLSLDFSQITFDWDNLLGKYKHTATDAQKNAVATLMYCCGIACNMSYGGTTTGGSGAWTDDMAYGLKNYFGYTFDKYVSMYTKNKYESASVKGAPVQNIKCEWEATAENLTKYFNADLEAGRPILMGGEDRNGGHEFVCDGRDSEGKFHMNWGWAGDCNCYCLLTALQPQGSQLNFSSNIDALIGLRPAKQDSIHVTSMTVTPTSLTLKQKEKAFLSASVLPANATDKSYTWSSSNDSIASVAPNGLVTGVSQGETTITATSRDGGKMATCVVNVTNEIIETTYCGRYEYLFTTKCTTGTNILGAYTWDIALQSSAIMDVEEYRGQQFGDITFPCQKVSLTTEDVSDCLLYSVVVSAARGILGDGQLAVFIDSVQIGNVINLSASATEYTFINENDLQGNLEIRLTNTTRALYLKYINLNTLERPSAIEDVYQSLPPEHAYKWIVNGQLYIRWNGHIYNAQGQPVH